MLLKGCASRRSPLKVAGYTTQHCSFNIGDTKIFTKTKSGWEIFVFRFFLQNDDAPYNTILKCNLQNDIGGKMYMYLCRFMCLYVKKVCVGKFRINL